MRTAKFCERNFPAKEAIDLLKKKYTNDMKVVVVDCFRRCLQCRIKPFCRIQLETIEATDPLTLVEKVLQQVRK